MSSTGGAGSGSGIGADGQKNSEESLRRSKRPKNESDEEKWKKAVSQVYCSRPEFSPVNKPAGDGDWVRPPMLVFFNAKGGTLKTSHTWSTAYTLSSVLRGLKVLVVDLDSQRDLTRSLLRANLLAEAAMNGEPPVGVQKYLERDFTPAEVDTYAYTDRGVNDRHFGKKGLARTLEGALDTLTKTDFADVKRVVPEEVANNLFLLPGSPVMEDIDRRMTISEGRLDDTFQRNWQGAPLHVIMETARMVKADIVLLDLNPSLSTLNRNMVMSSDYIVVTTRPEDFSLENMDTFMNKMTRNDPLTDNHGGSWLQQMLYNIRPLVNRNNLLGEPPRFPLPETVPKVLGCVIADYRSLGNVETKMNPNRPPGFLSTQVNGVYHDRAAGPLEHGMNSIIARMKDVMTKMYDLEVTRPQSVFQQPPVPNVNMTLGNEVYKAANLTCLLGKFRAYEKLGPLTHYYGVPAPFIEAEHCVDLETNKKLDDPQKMLTRATDFKRRYDQLAWNILKLMNSDPGGKLFGRLDWALVDRRNAAGGPTRPDDELPDFSIAQPGY